MRLLLCSCIEYFISVEITQVTSEIQTLTDNSIVLKYKPAIQLTTKLIVRANTCSNV